MSSTTDLGRNIQLPTSMSQALFALSRCGPGGIAHPLVRSYRLPLWCQRPGEAFEIEDPADEVRLLTNPRQPASAESAQPVPVLALTEQFLDLLPTALRQAVAEAPHPHPDPGVRSAAIARVDSDVRLNVPSEQCLDERLAEKPFVGPERVRREAQPAFRAAQQGQAAVGLRGVRPIDLRVEAEQEPVGVSIRAFTV